MFAALRRAPRLRRPVQAFCTHHKSFWSSSREYQRFQSRNSPVSWRTLTVLAAGGCCLYISSRQQIPYTGRFHAIFVSARLEEQLGRQTWEQAIDGQVTKSARQSGALHPSNSPQTQRVRKIGMKIASIIAKNEGGGYIDHMKNIRWEFAVINSPEPNAFVVPGGKVVVFTGLLDMIGVSDDELAAVLGHEAGHTLARHVGEKLTWYGLSEVLWMSLYLFTGVSLPQGLVATAISLPNSRRAESEADEIGLKLAAQACYNPQAAVEVFQKFDDLEKAQGGDRIPSFLRTHPLNQTRINNIRRMLPAAANMYESSGCQLRESAFRNTFQQAGPIWGSDFG